QTASDRSRSTPDRSAPPGQAAVPARAHARPAHGQDHPGRGGLVRAGSVVAGVLVATLFAGAVGLTWWSLGLVVAISLIAGRLLRLGPHLPEVAITAMLVLAVGGGEPAAPQRIVRTPI